MTVQELIEVLEKVDPSFYVGIADSPIPLAPDSFDSYRGYYQDLAIGVECSRGAKMSDVVPFLKALRDVIGSTMTGYKGGEYRVMPDTRVWISNYRHVSAG